MKIKANRLLAYIVEKMQFFLNNVASFEVDLGLVELLVICKTVKPDSSFSPQPVQADETLLLWRISRVSPDFTERLEMPLVVL